MSVLSYLTDRASYAVLSTNEKSSIDTSIATLKNRLAAHFKAEVIKREFRFGSSTRGTILPRALDEQSDIDYMIVFADSQYTPQTYIAWLKRFAEARYGTSEIYQSHPTIVLQLNHIKFDLVPATESWLNGLQIPAGSSWISTNPNDVNETLETANKNNASLIKPTIRLFKYWNATAGYPYLSFKAEKWITSLFYWGCNNQKDYFFNVFDNLSTDGSVKWIDAEVVRAKSIISRTRQYEKDDMPASAENEIRKLFRE